jgi:branched-chain amino acid transport system permease protein
LFDRTSYHLDVAVLIGIFSILSIGLNVLLGNTGQISLGHAAFFGIGAYTNALLTRDVGFSFWSSLPISSLFTGIIGYGIGLTSLRLKGHYLAMATLAFGIITSTIITEWTELTGGTGGFRNIPYPAIGSFRFDSGVKYFYLVWIFVIFIFLFTENFLSTRVGRALKAIHKNEDVANVLGINPTKYKLKIFGLSAIYAGVAGALFANHSNFISSESFSIMVSVSILCMITIGGLGKTWGSIMGASLLTLFPEIIRYVVSSPFFSQSVRRALTNYSYHLFIYGILMLLVIVFLPGGLISIFQGKGARSQNARS